MVEIDCVFLAGGVGKRMKRDIPKQLIRVAGKPIMIYSLENLLKFLNCKKVIITYPKGYQKVYGDVLSYYFNNIDNFILVEGGKTRQESVYNALEYVNSNRVLIHEAARPFITKRLIDDLLNGSEDAVVPVINIPFTVASGKEYMNKIFKRDELKNVQLPQIFNSETLKAAHEKAKRDNLFFTDDSTLVFYYGHKVKFVEGEEMNIKITTNLDLLLMEKILFARDLPSD